MTHFINKRNKRYTITAVFALLVAFQTHSGQAQTVAVNPGVDLYSTYVWRGVAYSGPSVQPYVEVTAGGFSIGAWGSQGIDGSSRDGTTGFQEMDLYASYRFDFGLSFGITDYYYPGTPYFSYKSDPENGDYSSHAVEFNGRYTFENLSLSANYILNESPGGAGAAGDDIYFQIDYSAGAIGIFAGGGDGWHSTDGNFKIVNVGVGTTKEIPITDTFTLPLTGQVILNPDTEQFYIVVGLGL